ncbi:hypothetical protein B9Z55_014635 [Caenorhabditis nigoni]|nr:hypothetical protein B9Z55_014635 [Caenorhabditis nigoni]
MSVFMSKNLFFFFLFLPTFLFFSNNNNSVHKKKGKKNQKCYSEYYAVNRSGTIRQYYDRFCVHESHCLYRGIDESCPTLAQLDHKMQSLFTKHHAKSQVNSIRFSEFCCCSTNLCNDVNHKRVYDKYGLQITFADNVFTDASSSRSNIVSISFLICIIVYFASIF